MSYFRCTRPPRPRATQAGQTEWVYVGFAVIATLAQAGGCRRGADKPVISSADRECIQTLVAKCRERLEQYDEMLLDDSQPPWILFHRLLARETDFEMLDRESGSRVSAIHWLLKECPRRRKYQEIPLVFRCYHGPIFGVIPRRKILQDHLGQFLMILALCGAKPTDAVGIGDSSEECTLTDLLAGDLYECHRYGEMSWLLPVCTMWNKAGAPWKNKFGEPIDVNGIMATHLAEEATSPPACWGTHWAYGVAFTARNGAHLLNEAVRNRAERRLTDLLRLAKGSQLANGHFPKTWTQAPSSRASPATQQAAAPPRVATTARANDLGQCSVTGHTLEWVLTALDDRDLTSAEWVHRAVEAIIRDLPMGKDELTTGEGAHSIHALRLYVKKCLPLISR